MNEKQLSMCLSQLGNHTRLQIFKLLLQAGKKGLSVSEIQEKIDIPSSTLSHHLSKLLHLELIKQEREGRILHCIANYRLLSTVVNELKNQCCTGIEEAIQK